MQNETMVFYTESRTNALVIAIAEERLVKMYIGGVAFLSDKHTSPQASYRLRRLFLQKSPARSFRLATNLFRGMREFKSHRRIAKSIFFMWLSLVGAMSALLRRSFFLRYKRTSSVRSLAPPFQAATAGAGLRLGFLNVNGDLFCLHNQNQPKPIF